MLGHHCANISGTAYKQDFFQRKLRLAKNVNCTHVKISCALRAVFNAPRVERVVEYKRAHSVALADQGLSQVRANEAISAGD